MKHRSTNFLRLTIGALGTAIAIFCVLLFPELLKEDEWLYRTLILGLYAAALPFFIALSQSWKILKFIDKNNAFSQPTVSALRRIKQCGYAVGLVFVGLLPLLYMIADVEDAPGILAFGLIIGIVSLAVAEFAALMGRMLRDALKIKSENDLTV